MKKNTTTKKIMKSFIKFRKQLKEKILAFTLVELLVAITILVILLTLGFIQYLGFIKKARDSTRVSDLSMINFSIETYSLEQGHYPDPIDGTDITFSGSTLWTQGNFSDDLFKLVGKINKKPVDILSKNEFAYSLLSNKREYLLGTIVEGELKVYASFIKSANALGDILAKSYTLGNYNGRAVKTFLGDTLYIISMPTILVNNLDDADIMNIVNQKRLSYKGYNNLPASYSGTVFKVDGGFDYDPDIIILYSGSVDNLLYSENEQVKLLKKFQDSISGTILASNVDYKDIMDLNIDLTVASKEVREDAYNFVEKTLKLEQPIELTSGDEWLTYDISNALLDNDTRSITQDLIGNIWLATKKGVNVFGEGIWLSYNEDDGLADKDTRAVLADDLGNIWFATNKGITKYDGTSWISYDNTDGLSSNDVVDAYQDSLGNIWFATNKGITKYDGVDFTIYDEKDGLIDKEVVAITETSDGALWFGTMQGVTKYDGTNWISYDNTDGLADKEVLSIYGDNNGNVWIGTINGVSKFDGSSFTNYGLTDGLVDKFVQAIYQDTDGNMWFGTKKGVNMFDGTSWELYDINSGLADNDVQVIYQDEVGNMWFGTKKGVTIYFK